MIDLMVTEVSSVCQKSIICDVELQHVIFLSPEVKTLLYRQLETTEIEK